MSKRTGYANMEIGEALLQPGFGEVVSPQLTRDPVGRTRITLKVAQLRPYEHNPRRAENPHFAQIKTSIAARGLDHPPPVSRRPHEEHFIIVNGGNSRLRALQELWAETGEHRFEEIECDFVPWQGEVQALTGHLIENDVRGEMTFLDRALAVQKLRVFYREAHGNLSLRDLSLRLSEAGYSIHHSHLSKLLQTLEYLYPVMPQALEAGLGKHQVERLLRLRTVCAVLWEKRSGQPDGFAAAFGHSLAKSDRAAWSYESAEEAVIEGLSTQWEEAYSSVRQMLAAQLRGRRSAGAAAGVTPSPLPPAESIPGPNPDVELPQLAASPVLTDSRGSAHRSHQPARHSKDPDPMALDKVALELIDHSVALLPENIDALRALLTIKAAQFASMLPSGEAAWVCASEASWLGFTLRAPERSFEGFDHTKARRDVFWFLQGLIADQALPDAAAWSALSRIVVPGSATNLLTAAEWDARTSASALAITLIARAIRHQLGWR